MQLKYKFYSGGERNPYEEETEAAYAKLTEERENADPNNVMQLELVFPTLDSWADYKILNSKLVFWQMERSICKDEANKAGEIEVFWEESCRNGDVGEWLKKAEADEVTKAMCFYMASLHRVFDPIGLAVDFRYYITEGKVPIKSNDMEGFSLEAYE